MMDGVSLLVLDLEDIQNILQNKLLNFENRTNCRIAKYKGLTIRVQANSCRINGSLHKFKNNGEANIDDFTYCDLENVLSDLYNEIGLNPENAIVQNLEIGVNIKLPYNAIYRISSKYMTKHFQF